MSARVSRVERQEVERLLAQGQTRREIATLYGVTVQRIGQVLRQPERPAGEPRRVDLPEPFTFQDRPAWFDRAACQGMNPDLFFTERGESTAQAKAVCRSCPVREACLELALSSPIERFGIWGGASERERKTMRRSRRISDQWRESA